MSNYYQNAQDCVVFDVLPVTFHLKDGFQDANFSKFEYYYKQCHLKNRDAKENVWVIKPGENSNRGNGIKVESGLEKIRQLVEEYCSQGEKTIILQKYISSPLLYK